MRHQRGVALLVVVFALSLPAVTRRIYASDEIQYFAFLRSLWFDHDLSFDDEYRHFDEAGVAARSGFHETFLETTTPTGLRPTFATIGCAILWAPFYGAGDLVARALHAAGRPVAVDGYSTPYVSAVAIGSAVYGLVALLLSAAIVRRVLGRASPTAVWAVWIGTPLLFYMYVAPVFAHACEACMVALVVWTWLRIRDRWTPAGVALLGALGALTFMVREQEALVLVGPALDAFVSTWHRHGRAAPGRILALGLSGAVAGVVVAVPQLWAYLVINGRLGPNATVARKLSWTSPHALEVLGSPEHGLFVWTPLAILAIAGLAWLLLGPAPSPAWSRDRRAIAASMAIMVITNIYVVGSVESWQLAGAFGQRRFVGLTPLFVLGVATILDVVREIRPVRVAAGVFVGLAIWWNLGLMAQFGMNTMDRQRLTPWANARRTFVDLPREAPGLAWRYLVHRDSFYEPHP